METTEIFQGRSRVAAFIEYSSYHDAAHDSGGCKSSVSMIAADSMTSSRLLSLPRSRHGRNAS
uniref:Uncharacterized protein n=1 Tax=Arundo donax TaxID=35708 RepID=A0A0A8YGX4_ARUDO